jgi:hypothetical protein
MGGRGVATPSDTNEGAEKETNSGDSADKVDCIDCIKAGVGTYFQRADGFNFFVSKI